MKVLDYYDKFECIGSECEDTCCSGWQVNIDKKTYRKYKHISDHTFRKEVLSNIVRDRSNVSGTAYKIKLHNDGSCPFLNEDKLCNIYKKCGESYLSDTCTVFPRRPSNVFNESQSAMSLACPEVTRLAILPESPVQLIDIDMLSVHSQRLQSIELKISAHLPADAQETYEAIRTVSFHIIQMRHISLDERLFILGVFLDKLDQASKNNSYILMNQIIVDFIAALDYPDELLKQYQQFSSNPRLKLEYSLTMLISEYPEAANPRFAECLEWLNKGLDIDYNEFDVDKIFEKYQNANEKFYRLFLQERGYFLENYLISHLFHADFPVSSQHSLFEGYLKLITCFTNIQTILIGMAHYHQKIETPHVLQLIQSYERYISHNANYLPSLLKKLADLKFNTMGPMMLLLKPS